MNKEKEVLTFENPKALFNRITQKWHQISKDAINQRGKFVVALSGGKTPISLYDSLSLSPYALSWPDTHIFLVDERFVGFTDEQSNYGMIQRYLLGKVDIPESNRHPIPILENTSLSAKEYEKTLQAFFALGENQLPCFDLIILGIGGDGHTASLFRDDKTLHDTKSLVVPVYYPKVNKERISLTLPVINNAKNIIFLVTGKDKARIVKDIVEGDAPSLPASLVKPSTGKLFFFLDSDSATFLN